MAYGKRHLEPPALTAAGAPVPAHVQARRRRERERPTLFDRIGIARGWWQGFGVALFSAATLARLGSDPATAWFALPMLLALAIAGAYGAYRASLDARRLVRTKTAPGVVSGVHASSRVGMFGRTERPTVRFTSADGVEHDLAARFPERALRAGRSVRVRYEPEDPAWVVVDDDEYRASLTVWRALALLLIPGVLGLISGVAGLVTG